MKGRPAGVKTAGGLDAFSEANLIDAYFRPLTHNDPVARDLIDDAALLPGDTARIVTNDMLIEGVHFRPDDPLDLVAQKALRTNLSDLAAMGAKPTHYFLACAWRSNAVEGDVATFARGLEADGERYKIALVGGDTTRHRHPVAPFVVSITALGAPSGPEKNGVSRAGASAGDDLYVTGDIGASALGLACLSGAGPLAELINELSHDDRAALVARYHLPEPKCAFGGAMAGLASAAIDVSDGLMIDAGRIAAASGINITIDLSLIPFADETARALAAVDDPERAVAALAGAGDDYEVLFTAPPSRRRAVEMAGRVTATPVTRIGAAGRSGDEGVVALQAKDGRNLADLAAGFDHFS